jgi:hypothetical protein
MAAEQPAVQMLPMFALSTRKDISYKRMTSILSDMSGQQQRLATILPLFKQHADSMCSAFGHIIDLCLGKPSSSRQLLEREPQLLKQMAQVAAATLQQLATQGFKDPTVSRTAATICDTLSWLLPFITGRDTEFCDSPSTPADVQRLRLMLDTGGLRAHTQEGCFNTLPS